MKFPPSKSIFVNNLDVRVKPDDIKYALRPYCHIDYLDLVSNYTSSFAFVKIGNGKDINRILHTLRSKHLQLYQRNVYFSRIKRNYKKCKDMTINSPYGELFDLSPADSSLPCIHMLNDDILYKIFEHLSMVELIKYEKVCRRFQDTIISVFIKRLREYKDGCICMWLELDGMRPIKFLNIIKNCGHTLKKLEIDQSNLHSNYKFLYEIGGYLPNLEELTITNWCHRNIDVMKHYAENCKNIKKFSLQIENKTLQGKTFKFIFKYFKGLEDFSIQNNVVIHRRYLISLPETLKALEFGGKLKSNKSSWKRIFVRCRELEVLKLHATIRNKELHEVSKFCKNMREMEIDLSLEEGIFDWSVFSKLQKLRLICSVIDINKLSLCESLEKVVIRNNTFQTIKLIGDFSLMTKMRHLTLDVYPDPCESLLETITCCKQLEFLNVNIESSMLDPILKCIECLPKLKELKCTRLELNDSIARLLCHASKKRLQQSKIKLECSYYSCTAENGLLEASYELNYTTNAQQFQLFYDDDNDNADLFEDYLDYDDDYDDDSSYGFGSSFEDEEDLIEIGLLYPLI